MQATLECTTPSTQAVSWPRFTTGPPKVPMHHRYCWRKEYNLQCCHIVPMCCAAGSSSYLLHYYCLVKTRVTLTLMAAMLGCGLLGFFCLLFWQRRWPTALAALLRYLMLNFPVLPDYLKDVSADVSSWRNRAPQQDNLPT